jgi:superoxide dismutase
MTLHYEKHYATYVLNLNNAIAALKPAIDSDNLAGILTAQSAINFNGG